MLMTYLIEGLARDELKQPDNVGNAPITFVQTSLQTCLTEKLPLPLQNGMFSKKSFTNSPFTFLCGSGTAKPAWVNKLIFYQSLSSLNGKPDLHFYSIAVKSLFNIHDYAIRN